MVLMVWFLPTAGIALGPILPPSEQIHNEVGPIQREQIHDEVGPANYDEPFQPSIPKPETLPGPQEKTQQAGGAEVRSYFFEILVPNFLKGFLGIAGATAVVFLIVGGIQFLVSFGNEEKLGTAKKTITWAVVGLLFCILSYAIVSIITRLPLPTERATGSASVIASINLDDLLPKQSELIQGSRASEGRVSVPSGDFKNDLIPAGIKLILLFAGTIAFIVFTVAGVMLVVAHGNEEMTKKVKTIFMYAVLGLTIIAVSYGVVYGILQLRFS